MGESGLKRSIAAEAFARGIFGLGSSFRFARARGAFCHSGWCQQCKVELSDGRIGLACQLPAAEIGKLRGGATFRAPLSLMAHLLRPWFYERIVLWPARMQQWFLAAVRNASGALPLNAHVVKPTHSDSVGCDVLVIGGGPAGRAAYSALRNLGVDVVLVDEGARPAGEAAQASLRYESTALGIYRKPNGKRDVLCAAPNGTLRISFDRLVVATGGYDRLLPIPGNDLPGILGLDAFAKLAELDAIPRGMTIGLYAPGDVAGRAAGIAKKWGIDIAWAAGSGDLSGSAAQIVLKDLSVVSAIGVDRLRAVEFSDGSQIGCDILVVGFRQPKYEFQIQAGQTAKLTAPGSGVEVSGPGDFPVITVGEARGVIADVTTATKSEIEAWHRGEKAQGEVHRHAAMPGCTAMPADTIVCPCEDVRISDIHEAVADGFDSIEHIKRRTGAATGPCQGKLCHALLLDCLGIAGVPPALPTMRPLVRPTPLSKFAGASDG